MKHIQLIIGISLLFSFSFQNKAYGESHGLYCPVCSGGGGHSNLLLAEKSLLVSGMYIPNGEQEKGVINLRYSHWGWMDGGIGYTVEAEKVLWNVRFLPSVEKEDSWLPGLIIGAGSVRMGESDQALSTQLIKSVELKEGYSLVVIGGAASLIPDLKEVYGIVGITSIIKNTFSVSANFDGENLHYALSWFPNNRLTIGGLLLKSEYPAVSIGYRFNFAEQTWGMKFTPFEEWGK